MRIEINNGAATSVAGWNRQMENLHISLQNTITSLKNAESRIEHIPGGVGSLRTALTQLEQREQKEEQKKLQLENFSVKTSSFLNHTESIDQNVANLVRGSQTRFFEAHEWLRPEAVKPEEEKSTWEKIKEGLKEFCCNLGKTIKEICEKILEFCKKHWKVLLGTAVLALIAIVATAVSGGGFLVMCSVFLGALKTTAISALVSGAIGVALGGIERKSNGGKFFDWDQMLSDFSEDFNSGFLWGAAFTSISIVCATGVELLGTHNFNKTGNRGRNKFLKNWGKNWKINYFSPNASTNPNIGGTLFKIGRSGHKGKLNFRIDAEVFHGVIGNSFFKSINRHQFLHFHLPTLGRWSMIFDNTKHIPVIPNITWMFVQLRK